MDAHRGGHGHVLLFSRRGPYSPISYRRFPRIRSTQRTPILSRRIASSAPRNVRDSMTYAMAISTLENTLDHAVCAARTGLAALAGGSIPFRIGWKVQDAD